MLKLLAIPGLAALLLAPGLIVGPSLDAAVFVEVGDRIRTGATLYVNVWDHKPPGIYVLLVAGQAVLPFLSGWLVSWLASLMATAGTGLVVLRIARGLGVSPGASLIAAATSIVIMAEYLLSLGGGLTEPIAALAVGAALRIGIALDDEMWIRGSLVGALVATGILVSVQAAAGSLAVVALVVTQSRRPLGIGRWLLAGFALPVVAVAFWLQAIGALPAAVDAVVAYTGAYRSVEGATRATLSEPVIAWTLLALLFVVVPVVYGVRSGLRQPVVARAVSVACLAWLVFGIASFIVQGRLFAHYAIPLAVPLGLLSAFGIDRMATLTSRRRVAAAIPFVATLLVSAAAAVIASGMELGPLQRDAARSQAVASVIRQRTSAEDSIWVWGNEPIIYLDAERPPATPYVYLYPLVTPGYGNPDRVARTLEALNADPPKLIIDAGSSGPGQAGFQKLLISRPLASDGRDLDLLDPLRAFVRDHYEELGVVDGWVIYTLRESTAGLAATGSSHRLRAATFR